MFFVVVVGGGVPSTISNNFGKGRGMTSCLGHAQTPSSRCALAAAVFVVILIFDEDIPNLLLLLPMTAAMVVVMLFDENLENVALSSALS